MREISLADEQEICKLYVEDNWFLTNIAKHMQITVYRVKNVLKKNNISLTNRRINFNLKEDYFSCIDSEKKAYILGLLFTDGSITDETNKQSQIRLELQLKDIEVLEKIKSELGISSKLTFSKHKNKSGSITESVLLVVRSQKMVDDLNKYGIVKNKTYKTTHLPNIPKQYQKDFLRGLIDGDGSIYKTSSIVKGKRYYKNVIYFCSYYQSICEDFQKMITNVLGYKTKGKPVKSGGTYKVVYSKQRDTKDIATLLYKDNQLSLSRKYELAKRIYENNEEDIVYSDH